MLWKMIFQNVNGINSKKASLMWSVQIYLKLTFEDFVFSFLLRQKTHHKRRPRVKRAKTKRRVSWRRRRRKTRLTTHRRRRKTKRRVKRRRNKRRSKRRHQVNTKTQNRNLISQVGVSPFSRAVLILHKKEKRRRRRRRKKSVKKHQPRAKRRTTRRSPRCLTSRKVRFDVSERNLTWKSFFYPMTPLLCFSITEEVKGERDAGKEVRAAREDLPPGNGRLLMERPRFMFNIADGGFTGQYWFSCRVYIQKYYF